MDSEYVARLENEIERLHNENLSLREFIGAAQGINWLMFKVAAKRGALYGWKSAYIRASTAADCRKVTQDVLNHWISGHAMPDWAHEQVDRMNFVKKARESTPYVWSYEDKKFLLQTFRSNILLSDNELAKICSEKFGHAITEGAVKGALYRIRRQQHAPFRYGRAPIVAENRPAY